MTKLGYILTGIGGGLLGGSYAYNDVQPTFINVLFFIGIISFLVIGGAFTTYKD